MCCVSGKENILRSNRLVASVLYRHSVPAVVLSLKALGLVPNVVSHLSCRDSSDSFGPEWMLDGRLI